MFCYYTKYSLPWPLYMLLVAAHCHCEKVLKINKCITRVKGFMDRQRDRETDNHIQTSAFHTTSVLHMTAHTQQMWTFSSDFL